MYPNLNIGTLHTASPSQKCTLIAYYNWGWPAAHMANRAWEDESWSSTIDSCLSNSHCLLSLLYRSLILAFVYLTPCATLCLPLDRRRLTLSHCPVFRDRARTSFWSIISRLRVDRRFTCPNMYFVTLTIWIASNRWKHFTRSWWTASSINST